jgi:hypothetical protein
MPLLDIPEILSTIPMGAIGFFDQRKEACMKSKFFFLTALVFLPVAVAATSHALDIGVEESQMQCLSGTVTIGDSAASVLLKCGQPMGETRLKAEPNDIWIYHFGATKWLYYLSLSDGKVERIISAPCRSDKPDCYDLR